MSTTALETLRKPDRFNLAEFISASCPATAARIERAIAYATKRKQETRKSYFVTDFGHSAMDCPMNRAAYKPCKIIFKS
jgi:ribose 5-phosphate isomerase